MLRHVEKLDQAAARELADDVILHGPDGLAVSVMEALAKRQD